MASSAESPAEQAPDRATDGQGPQLCQWCRRPVVQVGRGRPRVYCKRSCRQRDFEARSHSAAHGLDERQIILARAELDELRDRLYVLSCALDDVDRDFPNGFVSAQRAELVDAMGWLVAAVRPLRALNGVSSAANDGQP
jgi:hypothetical protein